MKSFLLRCYPASWRARYGDEFEAILEERPLGPFDVADILLAAIDAHLHLRGLDAARQRRRSFTMSLRLGGVAAILGGALFLTGFVAASINPSDDDAPAIAVFVAGIASLLFALIGLSSFQARHHPRLIWAAFIVPALGAALSCIGIVAMATVGDRPFVAGLSPWEILMIGLFATALGTVLFAVATYRTRTLSRPAAWLLAAGSALLVVVFLFGATGLVPMGTGVVGAVMTAMGLIGLFAFAFGWIALGWTAIRLERPATATA